jgi:hypothetical protein
MTLVPIVLSLSLVVFGGARQSATAPTVGYVLSFEGPWQLNGRDIKRGEGVPARAHVVLAPSARFDTGQEYSLRIVLLNNEVAKCETNETCRAGVTVPESLNQNPSLGQRLSKVWARIFDKPDRWVGLVSRGASNRLDLPDDVIAMKDGEVVMSGLIANAPPGRYRMTFAPIADSAAAGAPIGVPITWNGGSLVMHIAIPYGLYAVTLAPEAANSTAGRDGWILITDGERFGRASGAFAEARAITRTWGPDVPPNDVTRFLHAYLAEIAATIR